MQNQQIEREENGTLDEPQVRIAVPVGPVEVTDIGSQQPGVNTAWAMIGQQRATFTAEDESAPIFFDQTGQPGNKPCHMQVGKIVFLVDTGISGIFPVRFVSPVCCRRLPADDARQVAGGGGFKTLL